MFTDALCHSHRGGGRRRPFGTGGGSCHVWKHGRRRTVSRGCVAIWLSFGSVAFGHRMARCGWVSPPAGGRCVWLADRGGLALPEAGLRVAQNCAAGCTVGRTPTYPHRSLDLASSAAVHLQVLKHSWRAGLSSWPRHRPPLRAVSFCCATFDSSSPNVRRRGGEERHEVGRRSAGGLCLLPQSSQIAPRERSWRPMALVISHGAVPITNFEPSATPSTSDAPTRLASLVGQLSPCHCPHAWS